MKIVATISLIFKTIAPNSISDSLEGAHSAGI